VGVGLDRRARREASAVSGTAAGVLAETSDARFDRDVLGAGGPVLVEFFATWCESCRRFAPTLEKVTVE
jgi:thioredoxin 1